MIFPYYSGNSFPIAVVGHAVIGAGIVSVACAEGIAPVGERQSGATQMAILTSSLELRSSFLSIHGAEALIRLGRGAEVQSAFLPQADETEPRYRIGVWRVLARCATTDSSRSAYVERIRRVLADPTAVDRVHALESLAKLGVRLTQDEIGIAHQFAADREASGSAYAWWSLLNSDEPMVVEQIVSLLQAKNPIVRAQAAYSLWQAGKVTDSIREQIAVALRTEPRDSPARSMLIAAAGGQPVIELARSGSTPSGRYLAAMALAESPQLPADELLESMQQDPDQDVRIASAFACLYRKQNPTR